MSDESPVDTNPASLPTPYVVGYARPPQEKQFKKGTSGNPKGRPRKVAPIDTGFGDVGHATFDDILLKVVREPVRVRNADGKWT